MHVSKTLRNVPSGTSPTAFTGYIAAFTERERSDFYPHLVVQIVQLETEDGHGLVIMEIRDRYGRKYDTRGNPIGCSEDRECPEKGKTIVDHGKRPSDSL